MGQVPLYGDIPTLADMNAVLLAFTQMKGKLLIAAGIDVGELQAVDSLQHHRGSSMNSHDLGSLSHYKRYIWPASYPSVKTPFISHGCTILVSGWPALACVRGEPVAVWPQILSP